MSNRVDFNRDCLIRKWEYIERWHELKSWLLFEPMCSKRSPFSLSSSFFWSFQRRSMPRVLVRSRSSAAEAVADGTHEDFGDYCIVLPKEPFVFGTSQITPRLVPEYIVKPSYVATKDDSTRNLTDHKDIGKVKLGAQEELRLRKAASLARKVREFAKSLVQVWQHASFELTPNYWIIYSQG